MELTIQKQLIAKELNLLKGAVAKGNTLPILSNLLLEATGEKLTITATDLEVSIRCHCTSVVRVPGSLTVSYKRLSEAIRLMPKGDLQLQTSADSLSLGTNGNTILLPTLDPAEYPVLPIPQDNAFHVDLQADDLRQMIERTIFAITSEESRFTLSGALLIINHDYLTMVATDGRRLAIVGKPASLPTSVVNVRTLIPRKALLELLKLAKEETIVSFGKDETLVFFSTKEHLLVSRILDGYFPNYAAVIPDLSNRVIFKRDEMENAIRRAALVTDDHHPGITWKISKDRIELSVNNADTGSANETVMLSADMELSYKGDHVSLLLNAKSTLEYLNAVDQDSIALWFRDNNTPVIFGPKTKSELNYSYVLMPMSEKA